MIPERMERRLKSILSKYAVAFFWNRVSKVDDSSEREEPPRVDSLSDNFEGLREEVEPREEEEEFRDSPLAAESPADEVPEALGVSSNMTPTKLFIALNSDKTTSIHCRQ